MEKRKFANWGKCGNEYGGVFASHDKRRVSGYDDWQEGSIKSGVSDNECIA